MTAAATSRCLDKQFAQWVSRHFPSTTVLARIAEAVSYASSIKHSCVDLDKYALLNDVVLNDLLRGITAEAVLVALASTSTDATTYTTTGEVPLRPLLCSADGKKIWLQKYNHFEQQVSADLQMLKAEGRLHIVTGGPGTGKTWTAARRILQTLQDHPTHVIALAAPTGKAANNMMFALSKAFAEAGHDPRVYALRGLTLHSLLGISGGSPKPRRDRHNPLHCDLLVVDEASMIDLPMMSRLLQALPARASLLLLGDKDQLASVEAGSVLHEICEATVFSDCIKTLTESRRYKDSPEIGALATALNQGQVPDMSANSKVKRHNLPAVNAWQPPWLLDVVTYYRSLHQSLCDSAGDEDSLRAALVQQKQFQILCALREGPQGVSGINTLIDSALQHKAESWYIGKPVMITANDHARKLYNGEIGMVLSVDGQLKACFEVDGQLKMISAAQMPPHETAYAITVHKSQGSEYQRVLIVLPAELASARHNPVLTRELVYTAVTRARDSIDVWCGEQVLENAASKTLQRMSGLDTKW